jgi:NAD+ synthase
MSEKLDKIINWMTDFKLKNNVKGVVLGLSGGKDSTVVAMLAKKVFGDNVIAVSMPNGRQSDIGDVRDIISTLKLDSPLVNIQNTFDTLIHDTYMDISDKAKTNIAPRIRMTVLYGIAQSFGYLVIGTGNKSEAMIGWTTKFGDSACDFNPIGHLTCREVIEIGKELAEEFGLDVNYIVKKPADGLTSKTDEDNFGFTYDELDDYLLYGIEGPNIDKIKNMIKWAAHKRQMPLKVEPYAEDVR